MDIKESSFGNTPDGTDIKRYDLDNGNGIHVSVMQYGAICISVRIPDKTGSIGEITLGFDTLDGYLGVHPYFGATVGRFANRIANGKFNLNRIEYTLEQNDGANHLHGGICGFDKKIWNTRPFQKNGNVGVTCNYESPDMEEEYPGNLQVTTIYSIDTDNALTIEYQAITDKPTPINLTNHSYWNLSGGGKIYDHNLKLYADTYLPVTNALIPSGELASVQGTPFNFTEGKKIGADIEAAGGFDHCFVINESGANPAPAAVLSEPVSGRTMEVFATQPGIQFYSGNFLDGIKGRGGTAYNQHEGLCLETEGFPDAVNQLSFPSVILNPGEIYKEKTIHRFSIS